jgi:ubiquinone/menaquinone biosynthesis C-methylase UbiE
MARLSTSLFIAFALLGLVASFKAPMPRLAARSAVRLHASTDASVVTEAKNAPAEGTMMSSPTFKFLDWLISIPIVHDIMFGVYRKQVAEKAEKLDIPWASFMDNMWGSLPDLQAKAEELKDPELKIPSYFYAPIHAYKEGNLCWESAMEEDLWSKMMIAPLYNNVNNGDIIMREKWLAITNKAIKPNPKKATDLGCGTGLSMYMLDWKWPSIEEVTGVDLSTYKLAVCDDKKKEFDAEKAAKYNLVHAPAECSPVASNTQDLVSLCLVAHESPKWVSEAIMTEAFRILKPGGSFTMLDLDKENLENLLVNPFVAAIYKQTEPYMGEFLKLNPRESLEKIGFVVTEVDQASRSHRVYVAQKPELSTA